MRSVTGLAALLVAFGLAACGEDYVTTPATAAPPTKAAGCTGANQKSGPDDFKEKVNLTTAADGLQSGDLTTGTGAAAKSGDKVSVQYTGWLTNCTQFDSSRKAGRPPFQFTIGQGEVIKGWDQGVPGMKPGGKRRLVIPAALGYGPQGQGSIPANSTLIFDITLVSIDS